MAANKNQDSLDILNNKINSYKTWVAYDDELINKSDKDLTGYDKATLNLNPDLQVKRNAVQNLISQRDNLKNRMVNIESAQQYLQDNVSQQKERINKLYDLQDKAAAISASIQWTNRVAGWLWAASNVLGNSRWITDAQMQQQILQNSAQRESALSNVAQQEANIPSVLASLYQTNAGIEQANANAELARAQANYYNNQATKSYWWWGWWWSKWWDDDDNDENPNIKTVNSINIWWKEIKWEFLTDWKWSFATTDWVILIDNWTVTAEWLKLIDLWDKSKDSKWNELPSKNKQLWITRPEAKITKSRNEIKNRLSL